MIVLIDRFLSKINQNGENGCWEWQGSLFKTGYGKFSIGRKTLYAHRVSYEIHIGIIPKGMLIMHTCDNPSCVNPKHLVLGTQRENIRDMISKGRDNHTGGNSCGERNSQAKLSQSQVNEIRELYSTGIVTQDILAVYFGVSSSHISNIITGHKWNNSKLGCHAVRVA